MLVLVLGHTIIKYQVLNIIIQVANTNRSNLYTNYMKYRDL
jgi:hypothetical protein